MNYKVTFTAGNQKIEIILDASNPKQAVKKASQEFKVSVGEIKLRTSNDYL